MAKIPLLYSTGVCWLYDNGKVEFEGGDVLEAIIRANSREGRFGNHTRRFFSVNEHAINLAARIYRETGDVIQALQALWHEADEGLGVRDINSLLKKSWGKRIIKAADHLRAAVFGLLKLPPELSDLIHQYDSEAAWSEGHALLESAGMVEWPVKGEPGIFRCWTPEQAESEFIAAHKRYTAIREAEGK